MPFISPTDFQCLNTDLSLARLATEKVALLNLYQQLHEQYLAQGDVSPGIEWFLDNFYLVEQAIELVSRDLPTGFLQRPSPDGKPTPAEYPKAYALAQACTRAGEIPIDIGQVIDRVKKYQLDEALPMAEIWALPVMLHLGILENLAAAARRLWLTPENLTAEKKTPHPDSSKTYRQGEPADPSAYETSSRPQEVFLSTQQARKVEAKSERDDERTVINCLSSLRTLAAQDWKDVFEAASRVEEILRGDPAGVYAAMDFDTRDYYRRAVARLATASGQDESAVASQCVHLARQAGEREPEGQKYTPRSAPCRHVGYYLVGQGRCLLEASLGYCPDWKVRLRKRVTEYAHVLYLGAIIFLAAAFSVVLGWGVWRAGGNLLETGSAILLALIPLTNVATMLANRLSAHLVPPRTLPKMDFDEGIPPACKTMVVIPAIVGRADEVDFLLAQLERHYLGNSDSCLGFALLTDFLDADCEHQAGDAALVVRLEKGIKALNGRHGQPHQRPFYWFHRPRAWNPQEACWMGWERKRGKLVEFNRLLNGEAASLTLRTGHLSFLQGIRYVITLDADSSLPRGSARRLVATLAHPLNQAVIDRESNRLTAGYTLLQPRVEIHPASLNRSLFTRMFAGETGLDLYTRAVSDVYQDLFGEGIFVGKGIYQVAAFQRSLEKKIPENSLISHDLLEGLYGGVGLATDVVLYEDFPPHYLGFARRLHRWIRGDWQLLPWLRRQVPHAQNGSEPSPFTLLDRWKILDNLLQSLHRPALFSLLAAGWLGLPGMAWVWTLLVASIIAMEYAIGIASWLVKSIAGAPGGRSLPEASIRLGRGIAALAFLPYEAWICLSAIALTLVRVSITRKHLLSWTASAQIASQLGEDIKPSVYWQQMLPGLLSGLGIFGLAAVFNPDALAAAAPLLVLWSLAPQIAWWISRPASSPPDPFAPGELELMHRLARRTWLYFEESVGLQTNWLPIDNLPDGAAVPRLAKTSPTNLGLGLLATLAAADLGYLGPRQLATRLEGAFASLDRLPRHGGHFFNWYDVRTLSPLSPRYVSAVDSGNLAACLLALKTGLDELPRRPVLAGERWQGLIDALDALSEQVAVHRAKEADACLKRIAELKDLAQLGREDHDRRGSVLIEMVEEAWPETANELSTLNHKVRGETEGGSLGAVTLWAEKVSQHLESLLSDARLLVPWTLSLGRPPALFARADTSPAVAQFWGALRQAMRARPRLEDLPAICASGLKNLGDLRAALSAVKDPGQDIAQALRWCQDLHAEMLVAGETAQNLLRRLQSTGRKAEKIFEAMDFSFLFDRQRKVFSVGYAVDKGRMDASYYDLLASEARLASLVAIAKNDVPQEHWMCLARPVVKLDGHPALLSWGGSLFEYLMPALLVRSFPGALQERACQTAIHHHMAAGKRARNPWGLSESCSYQLDANRGYQYRAFGIKELAMNSKLPEDWVVAPYATALALPFKPQEALANLRQLIELGMLGAFGFYEAIDFTPPRIPPARRGAIVPVYMTHHQGMILLALANCLTQQVMVRRFHADPRIQTVELLLWEAPINRANTSRSDWEGKRAGFLPKSGPSWPGRLKGDEGLEVEIKST